MLNSMFRPLALAAAFSWCTALPSAASATAPDPTCLGIASLMQPLRSEPLLIVGEVHGGDQTPLAVGEQVCALLAAGERVRVGLEMPSSEQARLDEFLASYGTDAARERLLAGDFWQRPPHMQDGRSSQAMLALLERLRVLGKGHADRLQVLAIDAAAADPADRDRAMADALMQRGAGFVPTRTVALVGNVHALNDAGSDFDAAFVSVAAHLQSAKPFTVNAISRSGGAWYCTESGCGAQSLGARTTQWAQGRADGLIEGSDVPLAGYHATLLLPESSASPPAMDIKPPERLADNAQLAADAMQAADMRRAAPGTYPWAVIARADTEHRERAVALLSQGLVRTAGDYWNAAYIFHHGANAEDHHMAHALATVVVRLQPSNANASWLMAASWDRLLLSKGQPQWYGTQYVRRPGSPSEQLLRPVAAGVVSDAEREALQLPSLEQAKAKAAGMEPIEALKEQH